jgi:serine protease
MTSRAAWSSATVWAILSLFAGAAAFAQPPGTSSELIHVRFQDGTDVNPPTDALPASLVPDVATIGRLFSLSESELDRLRAAGETASGATLPDMRLWFEIRLKDGVNAVGFLSALRADPAVAEAQHAALPLPLPAVTPDFTGNQDYLGPATDGIDATFSSTLTGGNGAGVTIYDVEYNWLRTHEDLSKAAGVAFLVDAGDSISPPGFTGCPAPCDAQNREHGTAVLGELIADNDTKGVTGISWGASIGLAPARTTNLGYNPANAILLAVANGRAGDIIVIEQQTAVCGLADPTNTCANCGPSESSQPVFEAIQTAVANRFVVVEAAGNGGVDLDQAACGTTFDRTVRDSGAIIVGAGGSPASGSDRQRLGFSSYGSRVDLQGWGHNVMTTGYGSGYTNADDPTNPIYFYRSTFNGTSSATPIVAGAAANLQGIAKNLFGTPLLSFQIRKLLRDTGSPQLGPAQNIGPRPDLAAAIAQLRAGAVDLFLLVDLSNSFSDDLPVFKAQAPGIIDRLKTLNPNVRFGLGRFEDYPIDPFGSAASGDEAYARVTDLTFDTEAVKTLIAGLTTKYGQDDPQSQLAALYQAATGAGQDLSGAGYPGATIAAGQQATFRSPATKLFLLWTDAAFHLPGDTGAIPYPGPSFVDTITAIEALDPPMVMGISIDPDAGLADLQQLAIQTNAFAPAGGVDCDGDGIADITEGSPLVCELSSFGAGIGDAIVNVVEAAVDAQRPDAICQDVRTSTDPGVCTASVVINNGSFDPDGGALSMTQSPPSPYGLGDTLVTLRVADPTGLTDTCIATVSVEDHELPTISCNAPAVTPPSTPLSFTASASDNCSVASVAITAYHCFKVNGHGKVVDKTDSCQVSVAGNQIDIRNSGGVGQHIAWTVVASDGSGNDQLAECEVVVSNPGGGKP